jgi:hypothetical protein
MENYIIHSDELPGLEVATKNLINRGVWFLYTIDYAPNPNARFVLVANSDSFFLDALGNVLSYNKDHPIEVNLKESVYFDDLPTPQSLNALISTCV